MATNRTAHARRTYQGSGVTSLDQRPGFKALLGQLKQTFAFRPDTGRSLLNFGCYASILDIGTPQAIAISTDGIGTKAIVAQLMDKYDTVGIDCVAMNVNDVLCVGAEPIAMLDYIAVEIADDRLLEEIGKGLLEGARQANISIPGGEISQIREIIRSERPGHGFDLVGTCVGLVDKESIIAGAAVAPGDVIVGLASSGIHSNGLTLARKVLGEEHPELTIPTTIYYSRLEKTRELVKGRMHITGGAFTKLKKLSAGFELDLTGLRIPGIFYELYNKINDSSVMLKTFNCGAGFVEIVSPGFESRYRKVSDAVLIGKVVKEGIKIKSPFDEKTVLY